MDLYSFLKENQPFIYQIFKNAVSNNKVSQAYLIKGNDGAPTLDCAKYLAKSLICNERDGFACDECMDCIRFDEGNYADFMMIDGSKANIKVPDIEALQAFLSSVSLEKKGKKIYIINLLENSNKESVNALLKTLEEPNENVFAFITTQNETKLLPTIISRCQVLTLLPTSKEVVQKNAIDEGIDIEDAELLSSIYSNNDSIKEVVNSSEYIKMKESLFSVLEEMNKSIESSLYYVQKSVLPIIKTKEDARIFIDFLSLSFKDMLKIKLDDDILLKSKKELLKSLSSKINDIDKIYLEIMLTRSKIEINVSTKLLLEHIFIYILEVQNGRK